MGRPVLRLVLVGENPVEEFHVLVVYLLIRRFSV
jgi:hypothetical protein